MQNESKTAATPSHTADAPRPRLVVRTHVRAGTVTIRPAKAPRFRAGSTHPGGA